MVSALRYVLLIVGGFAAGLVLAAPGVDTYIDFGRESVLASDMAAVAAGAVVALLVATVCRGRGQVTTAALIGTALVGIVALPGAWRDDVYFATIGAGLLLGALTVMCLGSHPVQRQSVLAGGAVAGLVTATPIAEYRQFVAVSPGGYARYVEASVQPVNTVWLMLSVVVLVLTVATVTVGGIGADPPRGWDVRELVVGVGLPVVAVALYWSFDRALYAPTSEIGGGRWVLGVVMVPIVIAAALWLRGQTGRVLLAAAALYVSFRDAENWIPGAWVMLLIPLALVAVGAWLARRHPMPLVGIGVLAVCVATAILERPPWDNVHAVATMFAVPLAAAYTVVASLPSTAPVTATSLALPAVPSLPLMVEFGWTAYTPLTVREGNPSTWTVTSVSVSVVSVLACGVAMAWLRRRRQEAAPSE